MFSDILLLNTTFPTLRIQRTSEIGVAHLMVTLTMTDAPTHGLPGHAGVGAGVVGLVTNVQAVLVGIITTHRDVTRRGHGQLPTLTAVSMDSIG